MVSTNHTHSKHTGMYVPCVNKLIGHFNTFKSRLERILRLKQSRNVPKSIPNNLLQASSDLGANTFTTFRKVILPLTKEGVMTGVQVTFIPALSLFMITRLIAGNKVINIGTSIEEQFLVIQNYGMGSTIAIFLIVFMAFILIITKSKETNGRG